MLKRLVATASAALAVLVGAVGLGAPPAQASGYCILTVPAKISIWHPVQSLTGRLSGDCEYASWELTTRPFADDVATIWIQSIDGSTTIEIYDGSTLGKLVWLPFYAGAPDGSPAPQNTTYTEFRVGSWATTAATRSGSVVTVSTRAMRYATSLDKAIPWAGAVGQIQYRVPGTATWLPLKAVTTSSNGTYTYRYTTTQVRDYRTVYVGTPTIWNYTTLTVRK